MTYEQALEFIYSRRKFQKSAGHERIARLLELMDNPHKSLRFVHVVGTNGKGSVCTAVSAVLQSAGYITGLFTSPFVTEFGERIRVDGEYIPKSAVASITKLLKDKFPKIVNVKFTAGMESQLDQVESGEIDYIQMLHDFYGDFEGTLAKAKVDMQGQKIKLKEDETDIPCDKCGRNMVIKSGRFGKFLACPGYPECKNTKPLVLETKATCPVCGGKVIEKKTKKGYAFYGCGNYPECNFMTWDKPTDETCPQCGKYLFKKKGGMLSCLNEGCGFEKKAERKRKAKEE